ncbi:MAG: hypothetical protein B7Z47_04720 [Chthoniobacter sp. 12-60-6]|nr:MAG: hypothetical protein B7Z47_04720 [Chthoniobacter sp. 12-60-6]
MRHSPGTMKPQLCLLLFLACASLLSAQDTPKDPFVKDKKAAVASANPYDPLKPRAEVPKNILCLVETFTLPQADYAALLEAPDGHDGLYKQMLAAVKAGTARLDGCHLVTMKSGMRSSLAGVDELIFPTEWTPADLTGFQYPTALEMHQLGDHMEIEVVLDEESGALHVTHDFSRDRFLGMRLCKADATLTGVPVPDFYEQRGPSSCQMVPGVPALIATLNHDGQPGDITLVFATVQVITLKVPAKPAQAGKGSLVLTERVISLDRMKGWELLKKHASDGAACLAELKPLLTAKEAVLEHVSTIHTQPGTRALHQSGLLFTYATELAPPSGGAPAEPSNDPKKPGTPARSPGLAGATAFETRPLGFHLEVEPTLSEDAFADMTLAPEYVRMTGNLKDKNWSEHYPEMPVFSSQKMVTAYTQPIGSTNLVGTLNPPGDTGANEHKDEGRVWLLFMDVNLE